MPKYDATLIAHFYRASVMHTDVWRRRLDATTNWAVVTAAAVITFAFGEGRADHLVLLMALLFTLFFLVMESRRYQVYHIWEQRVRSLHRYVIAPALLGTALEEENKELSDGMSAIAADLANSRPRITLLEAAGYRIRRNYGALFTIILIAWLLRIWFYPAPATDLQAMLERAAVGSISGAWVFAALALFVLGALAAGLAAPSEYMVDWTPDPSPARQLSRRTRRRRSTD